MRASSLAGPISTLPLFFYSFAATTVRTNWFPVIGSVSQTAIYSRFAVKSERSVIRPFSSACPLQCSHSPRMKTLAVCVVFFAIGYEISPSVGRKLPLHSGSCFLSFSFRPSQLKQFIFNLTEVKFGFSWPHPCICNWTTLISCSQRKTLGVTLKITYSHLSLQVQTNLENVKISYSLHMLTLGRTKPLLLCKMAIFFYKDCTGSLGKLSKLFRWFFLLYLKRLQHLRDEQNRYNRIFSASGWKAQKAWDSRDGKKGRIKKIRSPISVQTTIFACSAHIPLGRMLLPHNPGRRNKVGLLWRARELRSELHRNRLVSIQRHVWDAHVKRLCPSEPLWCAGARLDEWLTSGQRWWRHRGTRSVFSLGWPVLLLEEQNQGPPMPGGIFRLRAEQTSSV